MSEVMPIEDKNARNLVDVYDELTLRLGHIHAVADVLAECNKGQADVNGAGYAICTMVEDVMRTADKYHTLVTEGR